MQVTKVQNEDKIVFTGLNDGAFILDCSQEKFIFLLQWLELQNEDYYREKKIFSQSINPERE